MQIMIHERAQLTTRGISLIQKTWKISFFLLQLQKKMNELSFRDISIIKSGGAMIDYTSSDLNPVKKDTVKINNIQTGTVAKINTSKKSLRNTNAANAKSEQLHKAPFYPSSTQMSSKTTSWKKSIAENNMVR